MTFLDVHVFLGPPNTVSQLGCPLVLFLIDRVFHFAAQPNQLRLSLTSVWRPFWPFANMFGFAVNVDNQRLQFRREALVIVRTTEPSLVTKLVKRHSANRTKVTWFPGE